jgi:hypothetical protein
MRIGILPALDPLSGRRLSDSLAMLRALDQRRGEGSEDHFVVFADEITHPAVALLNGKHAATIAITSCKCWVQALWVRGRTDVRSLNVQMHLPGRGLN